MSSSRCIPLLVLKEQRILTVPSLFGTFRTTELKEVDSTSGSFTFIEASSLRSTKITSK